jgi:excisionase family DNA binding protein
MAAVRPPRASHVRPDADTPEPRDDGSLTVDLRLTPDQLDALADAVAARLQPAPAGTPWLDTEQAADYLAAKPSRIHDLVGLGKLAPRRDGRRLLFKRSDLDAYLESSA